MFERFTKPARTIVVGAEEEARSLGSPTIEAEHLLLALARPAGSVLAATGLGRADLLEALETERERSLMAVGVSAREFDLPAAPRTTARLRWGASAKLALERSLRVALDRGDRRVEPGHVLLALLRAEAGTVPRTLAAATADRDAIAAAAAGELSASA